MTAPVRSAPPATIVAPFIMPPAGGLTTLAHFPDEIDKRWYAGYSYRTELPTAAYVQSQNTSTVGDNTIVNRGPEYIETIPVILSVKDTISTFSRKIENLSWRAERILEAYTSRLLERELWSGEIAIADNLPNRVLATTDTTDITPTPLPEPNTAVGLLVDRMSDAGITDAMIHTTKDVGVRLPDGWRNEETLRNYGFAVVAGGGYLGTGPNGSGNRWLYVTSVVNVRLSPIDVIPTELEDAIRSSDNTITYYAQRFAAVDFSGPIYACQVSEP